MAVQLFKIHGASRLRLLAQVSLTRVVGLESGRCVCDLALQDKPALASIGVARRYI